MAHDRLRGVYATLVVGLAVAAVLIIVRAPGVVPGAPAADDAVSGAADTDGDTAPVPAGVSNADGAAESDGAAMTGQMLTAGCEERARRRLERSRESDLASLGPDAVARLRQSGDTEHLLAAALISADRKELQEFLDRVLIADSSNRVAHWKNLENCRARGSGCDRRSVEAAVLAVDSANGLVWVDIASARMREQRWEDAEIALRRAAVSSRFDSYFMDYALLIERGLAAAAEMDYAERMIAGIGFAAASAVPGYAEMTRRCTGEAEGYEVPAHICFELGEQMARYGTELLTVLIGKSVQHRAALRLGDEQLARKLDAEIREIRDTVFREHADSGAQALLQNDAAVLRRYIDTFVAHGEIRATEALIADARRLRADPDYDQCNFVGNPGFERGPATP